MMPKKDKAEAGADMNDREPAGKVHSAVYRQCRERVYAAAVDVLMDSAGGGIAAASG